MKPRLIATDFDGTLVRSDWTVSGRTNKVLKELSSLGVTIVGITGRGPRLRQLCHRDLPSADFLVLAQGGFVYQVSGVDDVEALHETYIPGADVARAVAIVEREVGPVKVVVENDPTHESTLVGDLIEDWPWPVPMREMSRADALSGHVVKAFIRSDTVEAPRLLRTARELVPAELASLTDAGVGNVEICPPGINKDYGLSLVAKRLGIAASDTIAFGDAENDLSMFAWAGRSIAVANAHDHVKAAADELTASNDDDGVAVYLEKLFGL
ncbi:HAD-IIB family hydrolase [Stackebrandtia nassauensis]|uniref:HAD-superfamily hydrolase, subfamily IIB n=1 Tax=Stackebrandtia nassauensis (strain DSM 44728 / CIP 108903 / NRRL B-16338 / NBRC 102104 / LLR-40K-21) TaxID=446470 RepID=D3Q2P0_STANL|nr:HAD family hydrolase [Stackebrandtia nassauensis]ADD45791.1 HAD-superfamily hydrolase, subfamily IIB [Stackebrandtia nassauensis DSM 44728]